MAKNLKLLEVTSEPWRERWKPLQEVLKNKFDTELSVEIHETKSADLKNAVDHILKSNADFCPIGERLVPEIVKLLPNTTFDSSFVNSAGLLVKERGKWWPKPLIDKAFTKSVSGYIGQVDLNSAALAIGSGGAAKLVISSLVKMGFSTLNIADQDGSRGIATVEELRKRFFDVKFDYIPIQNLTTLPGIHSIVVNTSPLDEKDDLYAELYFFNFLKPGGVVVDLTLVPSRSPLIIEAEQWGARYLEGDAVAADRDALMIKGLTGFSLEIDSYRKALRTLIDAVPFDPSPYLKRFKDRGL